MSGLAEVWEGLASGLKDARAWAAPLLAVAVALVLLRLKNKVLRALENNGHMRPSMAGRFRVIGRWVVLFGLLVVVLHQVGLFENAWAVATTALAAVAVGVVAIWSILSNALAAVLILVYRPFRIGDEIELFELNGAVGARGRVTDMNLMFTALEQRDPTTEAVCLVYAPNNLVFQKLVRVYRATEPTAPFFSGKPSDRPPAAS